MNDENTLDEKIDQMKEKIAQRIAKEFVIYGVNKYDDDGMLIDNLDEIAIKGKVYFFQKYENVWQEQGEEPPGKEPIGIAISKTDPQAEIEIHMYIGKGKDYISQLVENPTWLEVAQLADDMIQITGDYHHVYLEGIEVIEEKDGVKKAIFCMGS